jgi:hypothetical protein
VAPQGKCFSRRPGNLIVRCQATGHLSLSRGVIGDLLSVIRQLLHGNTRENKVLTESLVEAPCLYFPSGAELMGFSATWMKRLGIAF